MKNGTYKMLLIAIMTFTFYSCNNVDDNNELFNAVVIGKGLDCGDSFLIKFNENSPGLPSSIDNTYYEINLPNEFKVAGKEIVVDFRKPKENEYFPCTTLGIGYNLIYIISAKSK
ncbi:hypothetical protein [Gelidibacter gilvus]|uniref:Lipoprotein n=1 Tax=Gelidibacter gilvus TaxID=59602 RepID=A0A4Q0XCV2_9FLAO|nr:hypothetical protein [Gelidibacter gilvus]RXJ45771.1 hypothetical protein ESZ48_14405 [Gelidibacter gilvus]